MEGEEKVRSLFTVLLFVSFQIILTTLITSLYFHHSSSWQQQPSLLPSYVSKIYNFSDKYSIRHTLSINSDDTLFRKVGVVSGIGTSLDSLVIFSNAVLTLDEIFTSVCFKISLAEL